MSVKLQDTWDVGVVLGASSVDNQHHWSLGSKCLVTIAKVPCADRNVRMLVLILDQETLRRTGNREFETV